MKQSTSLHPEVLIVWGFAQGKPELKENFRTVADEELFLKGKERT